MIFIILAEHFDEDIATVKDMLYVDYKRSKLKGIPTYEVSKHAPKQKRTGTANKRQQSHQLH